MNIKLLDCTLRDGGYQNNWEFQNWQIKSIIKALDRCGIEYIECGYLDNKAETTKLSTRFASLAAFNNFISEIISVVKAELFLMIDFTKEFICELPEANSENRYLTGFRLAFHKRDFSEITELSKKILAKGYQLYPQPMVTSLYSETELQKLLETVYSLQPAAFYIVDSFGNMDNAELSRLSGFIDKNLHPSVQLGLHAHNNLQLAFANASRFLGSKTERELLIDASTGGIGRGAGNLPTELIIHYLNKQAAKNYNLLQVLQLLDNTLPEIFPDRDFKSPAAYFLGALLGCHPEYPAFLSENKDLPLTDIYRLLQQISPELRTHFDSSYVFGLNQD